MSSNPSGSTREDRVNQVIAAYLKSVEEGKPLDRKSLLAQHADLADDLVSFFADRDRFEQAAAPLRAAAAAPASVDTPTVDLSATRPAGPGSKVCYFGDYELLQEIARGGMGVVYKARQVNLKRIVALKLILAGQLAGPQDVARFHAEAEAAAKLDHPGIVPIFEIGEHEGQHYFSMAFVDGESLARRVAQAVMEPREAAALMKKVAEAIAYAHVEGVIHRDLKPGNILLDKDGTPRVTDFGLAKRVEGESQGLTATGQVLGTPSYMPPEQAQGDNAKIGPLADVYSLGAVLYCLLTGRPPFQAASAVETLLQVVTQEPVSPRQLNTAVPRDLETIALRCLEKDPARRYGSAQSLAEDLDRWLRGEPIQARPTTATERVLKWVKRKPAPAAMVGLSSLAAALLVLVLVVSNVRISREQRMTNEALLRETDAKDQLTGALAREQQKSYYQSITLADQMWAAGQPDECSRILAGCPARFRGWEWDYLYRRGHGETLSLSTLADPQADLASLSTVSTTYDAWIGGVACSPDGERIAAVSLAAVTVWEAKTGRKLYSVPGHYTVAFSPDGSQIAFAGEEGEPVKDGVGREEKVVNVLKAATGAKLRTLRHIGDVIKVAFSGNGSRVVSVAVTDPDSSKPVHAIEAKLWDLRTGKSVVTFPLPLPRINGPGRFGTVIALSADGELLASIVLDRGLVVWDVNTGKGTRSLPLDHPQEVLDLAFSPDSKSLAFAVPAGQDSIRIWDTATGKVNELTRVDISPCSLSFSADGRRLAAQATEAEIKVWDVKSRGLVFSARASADCLAFSPDGKTLVSGNKFGSVKIWDTQAKPGPLIVRDAGSLVRFTPDGKRIVAAHRGKVRVFEAATGRDVSNWEGKNSLINAIAVAPDGRRLVVGGYPIVSGKSPSGCLLKVLDLTSGQPSLDLSGHTAPVQTVAFSPDGRYVASGSEDSTARIWDASTGSQIQVWKPYVFVQSVSFTPDSRSLITISGDHFVVFDLATGKEVRRSSGAGSAVSADGRLVASVDGLSVKIIDATDGRQIHSFKGHTGTVNAYAFSPDGRYLASGGDDSTVRLWDIETGQEAIVLRTGGPVTGVGFSPSGHFLAAADMYLAVTVWNATPVAASSVLALPTRK